MKYSLIYQSPKKLFPDTNSYRYSPPSKEVDVGGLAKSKIFFHKMKTKPAQLQSTHRGITVQSIINSDSGQQKSYIISLSEYAVIRYEAGRYFLLKFSIYCHAKHNIFQRFFCYSGIWLIRGDSLQLQFLISTSVTTVKPSRRRCDIKLMASDSVLLGNLQLKLKNC